MAQRRGDKFRYVRAAFFVPYVSEAPFSGTSILPLTNFRAESFTGVVATDSHGHRAGLRAPGWDTFSVTTENTGGTVPGQPTQIFRGTAFDCYWMATG